MRSVASCVPSLVVVACGILVGGAMTWLTRANLAADRERELAEARADLQERTRLALWRMDSHGASILLDESSWPEEPSTLPVRVRFRYSAAGSCQTDRGGPEAGVPGEVIGTGRSALEVLRRITRTSPPVDDTPQPDAVSQVKDADQQLKNGYAANSSNSYLSQLRQEDVNNIEQIARSKTIWNSVNRRNDEKLKAVQSYDADREAGAAQEVAESPDTQSGAFLPAPVQPSAPAISASEESALGDQGMLSTTRSLRVAGAPRVSWLENRLFVIRQVVDASREDGYEGAWIHEDKLRELLLGEIAGLLDGARLEPAESPTGDGMVLASFPFRLVPPDPVLAPGMLRPETMTSLGVAWAAALLSFAAIFFLVRGVVRLSERRASFVSSVTHELRTPLTTFRLYSDMLGSGAVKPEKQGEYLNVLSREADRLSHLVENVLAFSRIERGSARARVVETDAGALIEPLIERFAARLETAGLRLKTAIETRRSVRADAAAVEHILFNLVDNAAKYAAGAESRDVTLRARDDGSEVVIELADNGPGVPAADRRKIFRAFHKSAREAAETKPGVGLGLALSRRLARSQGGDLRQLESDRGARFALVLPAVG